MTCEGTPRGPVLPSTQMVWCGDACGTEGLRYANQGLAGRNGWLVDESYTGEKAFVSDIQITSFYGTCDPPTDGFVQSYNPEDGTTDNFSVYTFGYDEEYLLADGHLLNSELSFSSSNTYDLSTIPDHYKLVGPKNLVNYGVTGPADYRFEFNTGTVGSWDTEPELIWTTDSNYVIKGTEEIDSTEINLGDRTTDHVLYSTTVADTFISVPAVAEIDDSHIALARLVENGASYSVYLDVLEYDFTTETFSTVNSYLAWSDEPRPAEFVFSTNRIVFIPTWGANGTLYLSHPTHTNTKTEEGMLLPYAWDGVSAFTVGAPIESGIRQGHMGSCIGWDGSTDRLVYGIEDDNIATLNSNGSSGPTYSGARNSSLGTTFATGDGYTIAWDSDSSRALLLRLNSSSWTYVSGINWSYNCDTLVYSEVFHPLGVTGVRAPKLASRTSTSSNLVSVWKDVTETLNYASGFESRFTNGKSVTNQNYTLGWHANNVKYWDTLPNWHIVFSSYITDFISPTPKWFGALNYCMYNGAKEDVVYFYSSGNELQKLYNVVNFDNVPVTHVQIGAHYVKVTFDLSGYNDITSAGIGFESYNPGTEKRDLKFFLQFDSDPLYYVTSAGGLVSYSSLTEAKNNAESVVLYGDRMPGVDISTMQTLFTYILLIKEQSATYPLLAPKASHCFLEVTGPGLAEPEVINHFDGTSFRPLKRTSAGVLSVEGTPDFVTTGTSLVVSGTETRPLFSS